MIYKKNNRYPLIYYKKKYLYVYYAGELNYTAK